MVEKYVQLLKMQEDKKLSWIDFRGLAWLLTDDYQLDDESVK
ncbi:MAG TPA: hypothetical protein VLC72_02160 [Nitrosopumilaceae archaeon]|nr:hypothetical protein [Nitrosopumilaceae archaeon]